MSPKQENPDPEKTKRIQQVGCYGCLTYIFLFAVSASVITTLGFDTLWVVPFLAFFVLIWFLVYWRTLKS
jgi:hypothetical protein